MASFLTQCPGCMTSFRVSDAQMDAAQGMVRCGACLSVFSAPANRITIKKPFDPTLLPVLEPDVELEEELQKHKEQLQSFPTAVPFPVQHSSGHDDEHGEEDAAEAESDYDLDDHDEYSEHDDYAVDTALWQDGQRDRDVPLGDLDLDLNLHDDSNGDLRDGDVDDLYEDADHDDDDENDEEDDDGFDDEDVHGFLNDEDEPEDNAYAAVDDSVESATATPDEPIFGNYPKRFLSPAPAAESADEEEEDEEFAEAPTIAEFQVVEEYGQQAFDEDGEAAADPLLYPDADEYENAVDEDEDGAFDEEDGEDEFEDDEHDEFDADLDEDEDYEDEDEDGEDEDDRRAIPPPLTVRGRPVTESTGRREMREYLAGLRDAEALEPLDDDELDAIATEPVTISERRSVRGTLRFLGLFLLILVLIAVLALQYVNANLDTLSRSTRLRPLMARVCLVLECPLPEQRDLGSLSYQDLLVRAHPRYTGALEVSFVFRNDSADAQPFPAIELSISDAADHLVANRLFQPADYLPAELQQLTTMPGQSTLQLTLELADPGSAAVNYSIGFRAP